MSKKCILIIDDEKDILEFLSLTLSGIGYEVLTANSGEMGLQLAFEKKPIDLILLDIMMPVMDGWEVLQLLQVEANTKNIPIIMLSAKSNISSKIRSNQEGATDYLRDFKSNLIMGHIIPGGTGFEYHKKLAKFVDEQPVEKSLFVFDDDIKIKDLIEKETMRVTPSA